MNTYTVFCQHANGTGTIWISPVNANNLEEAQEKARIACADDWGHEDLSDVHVLGVAEGNVNILFWEDIE